LDNKRIIAGIDAGHLDMKAVIMRGQEILGYSAAPTAFDVVNAAQAALNGALENAGISQSQLDGIVSTGIFREMVKVPVLSVTTTVPEYVADVKGAFFLNNKSRTVIDIGGNTHKAMHYDQNGNLLDVIQNDKCADGLGIFYSSAAKTLGVAVQELSRLALRSTRNVSVAIQCAQAAESEAIDLLCRGVERADVANAVTRFLSERVAAMCTYLPLTKDVVVAGGLAKSQALIGHLQTLIKQEVSVLDLPEYVGAIGAVISQGGAK
jgi:(R)-2-hydroxyacyl-CoA dehydratese activating ATPase